MRKVVCTHRRSAARAAMAMYTTRPMEAKIGQVLHVESVCVKSQSDSRFDSISLLGETHGVLTSIRSGHTQE